MKKIGIYGGTFDPIHHAHLILAREALETLGLNEVIFVLAARSPHKPGQLPTSDSIRWKMLEAALDGENGFRALAENVRPDARHTYGFKRASILAALFNALKITGKPIEEPVAWYGPIVMNTESELRQAIRELDEGTFIRPREPT